MTYDTLWDWRRQIADLYAQIRAEPDLQTAWRHWRTVRDHLFKTHPQTPLDHPAAFTTLPVFDYDPAFRFLVHLEPLTAAPLHLPAGNDGQVALTPFARTVGLAPSLGAELTLYWLEGYGGGVFLPFADATSAHQTYGAGRYLLDTIKSADLGTTPDGRTILDFNFAYNPSCAHSPHYTCPLTPQANKLPNPVHAGEQSPRPPQAAPRDHPDKTHLARARPTSIQFECAAHDVQKPSPAGGRGLGEGGPNQSTAPDEP